MRERQRTGATIMLLVVATALTVAAAGPAGAAEERRAAVNGFARASGAFVPFAVNPNFDFWPVYSLSEINTNSSHGVSGGFWPGFLVDATFFQFGYQPFERAFFGVSESLWPSQPNEASAATHDFEKFCAAGEVSTVPLPFGFGEGAFPEPLLTGCQSMYAQYRSFVPWEVAASASSSEHAYTGGRATGSSFRFGPVSAELVRATSTSDARGFEALTSDASVLVRELAIGTDLRIKELRSRAVAVADGTADGAEATHRLTIVDATYQGQQVVISDEDVVVPGVGSIDDALAAEGIEVRLVDGRADTSGGIAQADAGGLIIRLRRAGPPPEFDAPTAQACDSLAEIEPAPIAGVDEEIATNPAYDERPPLNQTPPKVEIHETVPPPIGCPLLLMQRALDLGIVLGGASAAARLQPLPEPPTFNFGGGADGDGFGFFDVPGSTDGLIPGFTGDGPALPSFGEVPPVPFDDVATSALLDLGPDAARKVRVIYAGMAIVLGLTLAGRRVFRTLVMQ